MIAALLLALLAPAPARPALAPLLPLTETQMNRITDYGCSFGFERGTRTMIYAVNNRMLVRTPAGVRECSPATARFDAFSEADGAVTCGGLTLSMRRTGRAAGHPEADSVTFPAELTVRQGKGRWTMRGVAGTAC